MSWLDKQFERVDALTLRERSLLALSALFVIVALVYLFFIEPVGKKLAANQLQLDELAVQLEQTQASLKLANEKVAIDPDQAQKLRISTLQEEIRAVESQINNEIVQIVSPERMRDLLAKLLAGRAKLRFVEANNLPVETVSFSDGAVAAGSAQVTSTTQGQIQTAGQFNDPNSSLQTTSTGPLLYRHSVEIVFDGDYQSALDYLRAIEAMPVKLIWSQIELDAEKYPVIRFRLRATTLSLRKGVIGV